MMTEDHIFDILDELASMKASHQFADYCSQQIRIEYGGPRPCPTCEQIDVIREKVLDLLQFVPGHCSECDTEISRDNQDGLCYQCQCELHAIGAFDMDGEGWVR